MPWTTTSRRSQQRPFSSTSARSAMIPAVKHQGVMFKQEGRYDYSMLVDLFVYKD